MSDEPKKSETNANAAGGPDLDAEGVVEEVEVPALSALLKRSLGAAPETAELGDEINDKDRVLLASVQRKLRQRSKGKFYADGWSTSASRVNYALVAAVMLVVIITVYLALGPMGVSLH